MTDTENKRLLFVITLGAFIQFIYFLGIENQIFLLIGTVVLVFSALFLKPYESFCIFSFLLSNQRLIVIETGGASLLNIVVILLLFRLIVSSKIKIDHSFFLFYLIMIFYSIFLMLIHGDPSVLLSTFKFILSMVVFIFFGIYLYYQGNTKQMGLIYSYIAGTVFTGVIAIMFEGLDFGEERFSGGEFNNSNILGASFSFALALLCVLLNIKKVKLNYFLLFALPLIYFGILTQSRSFLLAFSILAIYMFISNIKIKVLFILPFIFIGGMLVHSIFNFTFFKIAWEAASERIINPKNDDLSGGRLKLWNNYIDSLLSDDLSLLFGRGLQLTHEKFGLPQVAHNFIIETVAGIGLVGCIIFVSFFFMIYFKFQHIGNIKKKTSFVFFIPIAILLSNYMTGHTFINMSFSFQFIICLLLLTINTKKINAFNFKM